MRIIDAYELDGTLNVTVEAARSTHVVSIPASADKAAVRVALREHIDKQEAREQRKVHRKDLLGDL